MCYYHESKTMSKRIKEILHQFRKKVFSEFSGQTIKIFVYGSCARGDERPDSDLDLLVIVKKKSASLERKIKDIAYEIMWEWNFTPLISVEIFDEEYFKNLQKMGSSFYRAIQSEGILL